MISHDQRRTLNIAYVLASLVIMIGLCCPIPSLAQTALPPTEKTFPGVNEIVPQATAIAARLTEAETQVQKAASREGVYQALDSINESLRVLEERNADWDDVVYWQINRLLRVQSAYADLRDQQTEKLNIIYTQLQRLESLHITWRAEKTFWQEWQVHLQKSSVNFPAVEFTRSLNSIDTLLKRINRVDDELVKAQQKYAPGQEVIDSRLSTIDKTLDTLRRETFRRNTFTMFETGYYQQFNEDLFAQFKNNLFTELKLPNNFFGRHGGIVRLQLFSIVIITLLLVLRRKQVKPLTEEWLFLFRRPLAGAIFISSSFVSVFTNLTQHLPFTLKWLMLMAVTIAAMRLLNAFYTQPLVKNVIRIIASLFIITESLRYCGLPTPLMQLYNVGLCSIALPFCWQLIKKKREELAAQIFIIYLIFGVALICLVAALFGNERLSTNLIDATLGTFIVLIMLRMALRLSNSIVQAFMQSEWIKNRHFIQVLGLEAGTRKLQTLLQIVIFYNTGLYLLVVWLLFDNKTEASDVLLGFEYTFGEFSISVKMILMVIIVLYLTTIISWVIQAFVDSQIMTPKKMDIGVKESLKRLTHYGLFTIGFLVAVSMAGLDLQKFTILAGALGVGIGFGMQNIVNNFVSGLILLFERPVKVGDTINIGEDWGTITRIGLRSTIFETFDRSEIIVPNADLIAQKVTNWSYTSKMVRVTLPVGVSYGSPLQKVLDILNRAAREHKDVLSYPDVSTVFEGFGNSSIDFTLRFWVHTVDDRLRVKTEVAMIVDRLFNEEGIVIPFPQQDLHLKSVESDLKPLFEA